MAVLSCCRAVGWRLSCYGRQVFARVGLSLIQTNSSSNFFCFGSVLVQTKSQRCPRQSFALSATSPRRLRPSFGHRTVCVPSDAYGGLYLRKFKLGTRTNSRTARLTALVLKFVPLMFLVQKPRKNTPTDTAYLLLNLVR